MFLRWLHFWKKSLSKETTNPLNCGWLSARHCHFLKKLALLSPLKVNSQVKTINVVPQCCLCWFALYIIFCVSMIFSSYGQICLFRPYSRSYIWIFSPFQLLFFCHFLYCLSFQFNFAEFVRVCEMYWKCNQRFKVIAHLWVVNCSACTHFRKWNVNWTVKISDGWKLSSNEFHSKMITYESTTINCKYTFENEAIVETHQQTWAVIRSNESKLDWFCFLANSLHETKPNTPCCRTLVTLFYTNLRCN